VDHGVNINCQDKNGFTPLINATKYGHTTLVSFLVSRGANLNIEDKSENNALDWAVYKGYPDLTRLLIIYGMNPKKINKLGQTLLHTACLSGNINIVQHLVEEVICFVQNDQIMPLFLNLQSFFIGFYRHGNKR
jgi:ankyrin repeat protein